MPKGVEHFICSPPALSSIRRKDQLASSGWALAFAIAAARRRRVDAIGDCSHCPRCGRRDARGGDHHVSEGGIIERERHARALARPRRVCSNRPLPRFGPVRKGARPAGEISCPSRRAAGAASRVPARHRTRAGRWRSCWFRSSAARRAFGTWARPGGREADRLTIARPSRPA
jgi:hypothetical protein